MPRPVSAAPVVADQLHSAALHLLRRLRREDAALGLTAARLSALSVLVFGGEVTIGQLARLEQVTAPTITRLIIGMERDGLARRERDAGDQRVVWVRPTARGTRLLHEGRRARVAALAHDLAACTPAERATLTAAAVLMERLAARPDAAPARAG